VAAQASSNMLKLIAQLHSAVCLFIHNLLLPRHGDSSKQHAIKVSLSNILHSLYSKYSALLAYKLCHI